ncbi:MAG: 6-phosphogluconolactonase [Candidatus Thermoplasmatota archaeon]|nr:6-phosphogluconolactonase [Candidatus Thermoplasmatota archaeon]
MNTFSQFGDLAKSMAIELSREINDLIDSGKSPVIALSGGTTPSPVYRSLAAMNVNWDKCNFLMGDDRCVPLGSERCNLTMAKKAFQGIDSKWSDIRIESIPKPDIAIFGWGLDGHTASWFPDLDRGEIENLFTTDALKQKVSPPSQSEQRMTLTWSALSSASHIHLLGKGQEKMQVLRSCLESDDSYSKPMRMLFNHDKVKPQVWWSEQ